MCSHLELPKGRVLIVSTGKNFIFVHIYKTGGSSLTKLLGPHADPRFRSEETSLSGRGWQGTWHYKGAQHSKLTRASKRELQKQGINIDDMFLITFVRNPYSWILSVWNNFYRNSDSPSAIRFASLFPEKRFKDFVEFISLSAIGVEPPVLGSITQSLFVPKKIKSPDFVGHFETFEADLQRLMEILDIDYSDVPHEVRHKMNDREDFMSFYDQRSKRIVQRLFREDFERFGYEM